MALQYHLRHLFESCHLQGQFDQSGPPPLLLTLVLLVLAWPPLRVLALSPQTRRILRLLPQWSAQSNSLGRKISHQAH